MLRMRPSFLARHEWKTVPWSLNRSKDLLHHLLDHVLDIPQITSQFADIEESVYHGHTSASEGEELCLQLAAQTQDLISRLQTWKRDWADAYSGGQPYHILPPPLAASNTWETYGTRGYHLPPFVSTRTGPMSNIYYPDIFLAQALTIYYAAMISISRLGIFGRRYSPVSEDQEHEFASSICQSAEYLIFFTPGESGALTSLFPLRVAYVGFPDGSLERNWLAGLFVWMARKTSLGHVQHARPDLRAGQTYGRIGWSK
jgi:hypothetical protein